MTKTVVGIVAEYNPLHNGHAHHLRVAREAVQAAAVVTTLSSHFVQRGEPAFVDKWVRASMALAHGADLVLELPTAFSCANAGVFANGAVDILAATGLVTHIAFGMENPETNLWNTVDILVQEPPQFKEMLRKLLGEGFSFVEARARAVDSIEPGSGFLLGGANNSLAVAYCQRIAQKGYAIEALPVRRVGRGYHDPEADVFASATAVRQALREGRDEDVRSAMPEESYRLLTLARDAGRCVLSFDSLWRLVKATLLRSSPEEIAGFAEMGEGIENRLREAARLSVSWEEMVDACTSKRYPRGRIQRHFVHALLGFDHWTNRACQRLGPPYIRVLGANATGKSLLREMRQTATLPVVTRASAPNTPFARRVRDIEHLAGDLWEMTIGAPEIETEARRRVLLTD